MEKRISAYFYATRGGREPVRDWLLGLSRPDRYVIGVDIKASELAKKRLKEYQRGLRNDEQ